MASSVDEMELDNEMKPGDCYNPGRHCIVEGSKWFKN
jgi:hypothetical protein